MKMRWLLLVLFALVIAACGAGKTPVRPPTHKFGGESTNQPSPRMMIATFTPTLQVTWTHTSDFIEDISAAVSIHHGTADAEVPLAWSKDLCERLTDLGKTVECYFYSDQPHTFVGDGELLFNLRMVNFFDKYLNLGD